MRKLLNIIFLLAATFSLGKDKGKGLLYISTDKIEKVQICIYKSPTFKSNLLGKVVFENLGEGQTDLTVYNKNLKEYNFVEFEYERLGIPICEVVGNWVKILYGYDFGGNKLVGWINHKKENIAYFLWKDYLISKFLIFESPEQIKFYNNINGIEVDFKLEFSQYLKYDYIMKPLKSDGVWMEIELTTPSDSCSTPENKRVKVFWIKYIDQKGRPLVWYFTRGC